jgi:pseudaminic acid cytidylyltransferase
MKRLAIIPARGGSKRLPKKNVLSFAGRPMIAYSIEAARQSKLFDTVLVSTEDPEIAAAARAEGAEVMTRPAELATDTATVNQTLLAALHALARAGRSWDRFCCLYATAPLRSAADLIAMEKLLDPPHVCFVMAVSAYGLPPHQAMVRDDRGYLRFQWPELGQRRASDLPAFVVDNGSTYWADVEAYRKQQTFYGDTLLGYEMPLSRSIDIDTREQFDLALATRQLLEAGGR